MATWALLHCAIAQCYLCILYMYIHVGLVRSIVCTRVYTDMANLVYAATYRLSIRAPRVEQQLASLVLSVYPSATCRAATCQLSKAVYTSATCRAVERYVCERSSSSASGAGFEWSSSASAPVLECERSSARAPFIEFHTFKLASTIARTRRSSISST